MIGTLLLHALVLHSTILGTRAVKVLPPKTQVPGATLIKSPTEPAEALILVELPSVERRTQMLSEGLSSVGDAPPNVLVTLISPDPLPQIDIPTDLIDENADTVAKVDTGDPAGRAVLFGRYSGQIQARIERSWERPRSAVNTEVDSPPKMSEQEFRCQVRILQDIHGAVQEVQMLDCNGGLDWRQSLVSGILAASPLPAPPDPAVFTRSLTMTFEGQTYVPGSSTDGYEVERSAVVPIAGNTR